MITLAILKDELVDGQRRAAGRKIRKIVIVGVDNYNVAIAEGADESHLAGKKFAGRLGQLSRFLPEWGIDPEHAKAVVNAAFARLTGEEVNGLSWEELDKRFSISERTTDSSGRLKLYGRLKEAGWKDDEKAEAA